MDELHSGGSVSADHQEEFTSDWPSGWMRAPVRTPDLEYEREREDEWERDARRASVERASRTV